MTSPFAQSIQDLNDLSKFLHIVHPTETEVEGSSNQTPQKAPKTSRSANPVSKFKHMLTRLYKDSVEMNIRKERMQRAQ